MNIAKIAAKFVANKGGEIAAKVLEGADNLFTSKEEKMAMELKISEAINRADEAERANVLETLKVELGDIQNARASNVSIQESDKASWMAKNFAYYMDAFFVVLFGVMLFVIMKHEVPAKNVELFYTAFGSLGAYVATVVNFHRGTSQSSHAKQKQLDNIQNKK